MAKKQVIKEKRLEDILEPEVDEKYFLKDDAVSKFLKANDKDTALFHQFALPPTHEDAMFLKTWLQWLMEYKDGWEMTPTALDAMLNDEVWQKTLAQQYADFKQGKFPSPKFKARFEENMKR